LSAVDNFAFDKFIQLSIDKRKMIFFISHL
jgi:hypothetical protein